MKRDEIGRPVAADGYPIAGMATVTEVVAVSGLSRSKIYQLMAAGELRTQCYGRSRRVPWAEVRRLFLAVGAAE